MSHYPTIIVFPDPLSVSPPLTVSLEAMDNAHVAIQLSKCGGFFTIVKNDFVEVDDTTYPIFQLTGVITMFGMTKVRVKCDASNNPPESVASGVLTMDVTLPRPMPPKLKPITVAAVI